MRKVSVLAVLLSLVLVSFVFAGPEPRAVLKDLSNVAIMVSAPNGRIAASGEAGELVLFGFNNPAQRYFFESKVTALAFSPDGNELAIGFENGAVEVRDLSVKLVRKLGERVRTQRKIVAVDLSSFIEKNRRYLVVAYEDRIVEVYNIATTSTKPLKEFQVEEDVKAVTVVPNLSVEFGAELYILTDTRVVKYSIAGEEGAVLELGNVTAFAKDFQNGFVVATDENTVNYVRNLTKEGRPQVLATKSFDAPVKAVAVSAYPRDERILFVAQEENISFYALPLDGEEAKLLWNLSWTDVPTAYLDVLSATIEPLRQIKTRKFNNEIPAFSFVLGTTEEIAKFSIEAKGASTLEAFVSLLEVIDYYGIGSLDKVKASWDGSRLFVLDGQTLKLYDLTAKNIEVIKPVTQIFDEVADFAAATIGGKAYVVVTDGEEVLILSAATFEEEFASQYTVKDRFVPGYEVRSVEIVRNGDDWFALAFLSNGRILAKNIQTGKEFLLGRVFNKEEEEVVEMKIIYSAVESKNRAYEPFVVSLTNKGRLNFWKLFTDEPIVTDLPITQVNEAIEDVLAVSPNGAYIAVATKDYIRIYTFRSLLDKTTRVFKDVREIDGATAIAFSSDSSKLVIGKEDGTVVFVDLNTDNRASIDAHFSGVVKVLVAGDKVITVDEESFVKIW